MSKMVEKDVGFVGDVMNIKSDLLKTVIKDGYIPVVATVACDDDAQTLNINADLAAGEVSGVIVGDSFHLNLLV